MDIWDTLKKDHRLILETARDLLSSETLDESQIDHLCDIFLLHSEMEDLFLFPVLKPCYEIQHQLESVKEMQQGVRRIIKQIYGCQNGHWHSQNAFNHNQSFDLSGLKQKREVPLTALAENPMISQYLHELVELLEAYVPHEENTLFSCALSYLPKTTIEEAITQMQSALLENCDVPLMPG